MSISLRTFFNFEHCGYAMICIDLKVTCTLLSCDHQKVALNKDTNNAQQAKKESDKEKMPWKGPLQGERLLGVQECMFFKSVANGAQNPEGWVQLFSLPFL